MAKQRTSIKQKAQAELEAVQTNLFKAINERRSKEGVLNALNITIEIIEAVERTLMNLLETENDKTEDNDK